MEINGREITFAHTVDADCRVADLCRDGNPANIGELFEGGLRTVRANSARFMAALSEAAESYKRWQNPDYHPNPLTAEEAFYLDRDVFDALFTEAQAAWTGEDAAETVETEPVKKNEV